MLYSLQGDDENYLDIVERYENNRPDGHRSVDLFSQAFGYLQRGLAETDADLLGVIYEELGVDSEAFGQYFTPHDICDVIAEMVIDADADREEPYTVADPASGSGRFLLAAAKNLPDGVDAVFYGQDKDSTCAKMTALNLCFFNLDGYAVYGDSLTLEKHRVWQTHSTPLGGRIRELEESEFPDIDYEAIGQGTPDSEHTGDTIDSAAFGNIRDVDLTDF